MKKGFFILIGLCFLQINGFTQTITDIDGNTYNTISIESKIWMKENLKVKTLNDGTDIPLITNDILWESATTPAYCNYNNTDHLDSINTFGRLYNWLTVESNKLCPSGWHVPTVEEWVTLFNFLDSTAVNPEDGGTVSTIANKELNDSSSSYWTCLDKMKNNSDFTALPAGYRTNDGRFITIGILANFWTSTSASDESSWKYDIDCKEIYKSSYDYQSGFSVRCIKGSTTKAQENIAINSINIYPNPSSDIISIENPENLNSNLLIYNYSGVIVLQKKLHDGKNNVNISYLQRGMYIINVENKSGLKNSKIFIKH